MRKDDEVIWLPAPWTHGVGVVKGVTDHGWLWVEWQDGHFDSYDPQQLEHSLKWEQATLTAQ